MSEKVQTRPWKDPCGPTAEGNETAGLMRDWMKESALTLDGLHRGLSKLRRPKLGRTAVADRLAGRHLSPDFVDAVASVCFSDLAVREARAKEGRAALASLPPHEDSARADNGSVRRTVGGESKDDDGGIEGLRGEMASLGRRNARLADQVKHAEVEIRRLKQERDGAREKYEQDARRYLEALERLRLGGAADILSTDWPSGHPMPNGLFDLSTPCANGDGSASLAPTAEGSPGMSALLARVQHVSSERAWAHRLSSAARSERLVFDTFREMHIRSHIAYARKCLLDEEAVKCAVSEAYKYIAAEWELFLQGRDATAMSWGVLKAAVRAEEIRHQEWPALRRILRQIRASMAISDSELGLYQAISTLPDREFVVVVLRWILGYPSSAVAEYMGVSHETVRRHYVGARANIRSAIPRALYPDGLRGDPERW